MKKILLAAVISLLLVGCGGGTTDTTPTPRNKVDCATKKDGSVIIFPADLDHYQTEIYSCPNCTCIIPEADDADDYPVPVVPQNPPPPLQDWQKPPSKLTPAAPFISSAPATKTIDCAHWTPEPNSLYPWNLNPCMFQNLEN